MLDTTILTGLNHGDFLIAQTAVMHGLARRIHDQGQKEEWPEEKEQDAHETPRDKIGKRLDAGAGVAATVVTGLQGRRFTR